MVVSSLKLSPSKGDTYQLFKIPPADLHVPAVVIHALGERLSRSTAVVAPGVVVGSAAIRALRSSHGGLSRGAAEHTADRAAEGVADSRANRDTTMRMLVIWPVPKETCCCQGDEGKEKGGGRTRRLWPSERTYHHPAKGLRQWQSGRGEPARPGRMWSPGESAAVWERPGDEPGRWGGHRIFDEAFWRLGFVWERDRGVLLW